MYIVLLFVCLFLPKGKIIGDEKEAEKWSGYTGRGFDQLEWWGESCKQHRLVIDPVRMATPFMKAPDQRNAP